MPESGLLGFPGQGPPVDLDANTQLFTSSGTWTKPADCQWVRVILVGGGGGGGGGGRGTNVSSAAASGGAGGAGGAMSFIDIPSGYLPSTVIITIGAGGSGGAGSTAAETLGSSGTGGGSSSFGDILVAEGGQGGGRNDGGGAGAGGGRGHLLGGSGSERFFGAANITRSYLCTAGGAGGGSPAAGGGDVSTTVAGSAAMATSPFGEPQKFGVLGQAGAGGGYNLFGTRINSVSSGTFGNGGGGGGGGKDALNGETGGDGGAGYCLVISYGTRYRPVDVQEFTTSGTWQKPTDPRLTTARVFAIGGGGGGGSGRRWNRLNGGYLTGSGYALSSNVDAYASSPDTAALSITGDIDIQAKVAAFSWCESDRIVNNGDRQARAIVSKWATSGNQRSYSLRVNSNGHLILAWSNDGVAELSITANATLDFERLTTKWVRATLDVNNGAGGRTAKFYTSNDGTTWTQLGSDRIVAGTTSIFDSTAALTVGNLVIGSTSNKFEGIIYRVSISNGYDGAGSVVYDAVFESAAAGAASFTESSANAATVTINNATTNNFGGGGGGGGAVSYAEIPLASLPSSVSVTVGLGGAGGLGVTNDYENGAHGSFGGGSSFGSLLTALGGERGYGGTCAAGSNHIGRKSSLMVMEYNSYNPGTLTGGGSGASGGSQNGSSTSENNYLGVFMTGGGGGGGGINSGGSTGTGGQSLKPLGYGTIISSTTATNSGSTVCPTTLGMFGSTGGGGGSSNSASVNGGNGVRGSGGGGGAATTTGTTSGAGGNGGDGYVLVVCV